MDIYIIRDPVTSDLRQMSQILRAVMQVNIAEAQTHTSSQ